MSQKTKTIEVQESTVVSAVELNDIQANVSNTEPEIIILLDEGKALKLSPKTQSHVFYQLGEDDEGKRHIRMSGNEGGGLHTKIWIELDAIFSLLEKQSDKPFKSTVFKPVFKSGSSNNCGFLAAILRSKELGLMVQSEQSIFVHKVSKDYNNNKQRLLISTSFASA